MSDKYVVVSGYRNNETGVIEFIQAIGTYNDVRQAYGVMFLQANELIEDEEKDELSGLYRLEGETGFGINVHHETTTDFVYVLFCHGWGEPDLIRKEGD